MTPWFDLLRSQVYTHEYLETISDGVVISNYCYEKSHWITKDVLFCDLRKRLNPLNFRICGLFV